jgi:hypothetical protein
VWFDGGMTKLRWVAVSLLAVGVIAAMVPLFGLAGPEEVPVRGNPEAVATAEQEEAPEDEAEAADEDDEAAEEDEGERVDIGDRSDRANEELGRNKLIVGGMAVTLAGIVWWGRRVRKRNRNKIKAGK